MKQTIVVKLGGEVIASSELSQLTADLAELGRTARLVVTHGGGPQATTCKGAKPLVRSLVRLRT